MAEVKQEVKQENLKEAKAPPVENNQKGGSPKQPEPPKAEPQKEEPQKRAEPDKTKQETSQKTENQHRQDPDLTQAQAPRDFYKANETSTAEATYVPGESPKEKGEPKEAKKTTEAKGGEKSKGPEEIKEEPKRERNFKDPEEQKKSGSNQSTESSSKSSAEAKHVRSEQEPGKPQSGVEQKTDRSQQRFEVGARPSAKITEDKEGSVPRRDESGVRPTSVSKATEDKDAATRTAPSKNLDIEIPKKTSTSDTQVKSAETKEPQRNIVVESPQKRVEISKPETSRKEPVSVSSKDQPQLAPARVVHKEITPGRVIETIRHVAPEIAVRLTAQIVERFPIRAENPVVEKKTVTAQRRQEHFKAKVVEPKRIAAPNLNNRIQELIAAVREVSLQRNVVRTRYKVEAKKELLKDNTSLLKRLRADERKESLIFKPLQELDRLVIKYSPPLAVKAASEKILEKLIEARKAPEIMIKVFETVTAISTSAERLLQKLRDPSLEKLLPPETLSKLQGLIQELVRSSLPLGTDPEGLTPERLQSLKSKIEELIAKMREELLHLDLTEDDLSDLIDVLESLNELEALEELLLEELILLEEPSTFEEVLAEENVIILPEEAEEDVEEVFILEGYVIDSETELGISNVEVYGGLLGRELTDSDGYFSFINIPKGSFITIGLDPELGRCEPEIFSVTVSHNEMVRFFVTK